MSLETKIPRGILRNHFDALERRARAGQWDAFSEKLDRLYNYTAEVALLAQRLEDLLEQAAPHELRTFQISVAPPSLTSARSTRSHAA